MKRLVAVPLMLALAACGGGGSAPAMHQSAGSGANGTIQSGTLGLTFGSQAATSATTRRPKFVSPNAATAIVAINNGTPASFDVSAASQYCQTVSSVRTCAIPLPAPAGLDSISVTLMSASPAVMLGQGSNSVTVVMGTPFTLAVGINPVVAGVNSFNFSPSPSFQYMTTSSIAGTVVFADPSGAPITGSGNVPNFAQPITITSSDPHITFPAGATLTTPGQSFTAHYDGSPLVASKVTITAMSGTTVVATGPVILPGLNVTRFNLTTLALYGTIDPTQITLASDGTIWWGEAGTHMLGRINPAIGITSLTHFASGLGTGPTGITMGGDGAIWYSGGSTIGRISLVGLAPGTGPATITVGGTVQQLGTDSQGNVWFVNSGTSQVSYIDAAYTPHVFSVPTSGSLTQISGLTLGADNAMYFTENGGATRNVARVTTPANGVAGTVTETGVANSGPTIFPWDIAAGPDGNLWFGEFASNGAMQFFGKFPPVANPTITEYSNTFDPNAFANLVTMARGFDGNMWIAEGGGALSIPPANPTMPNVQFFTDNGQTTMVKCIGGPDSSGLSNPGQIWCTAIGGPPLDPGFIATTDSIVTWKPR